ncbi:hypothetical protein SLEP1_g57477 [Rubroshorea leprosula]|uniref:Uncharacterized protein n=1 Tax=Rubroshorea leprosula TaxID=152421 RepID=A0AAV5MQC9_9ROSI|nr:hypothetical protein SLEP1_g57477 [Rubroshorea leprosula]
MSNKETLSIGGNEEVRALEYGDVDVTSESSGSERTKEGVGGSEMAEVEGEGVLINVLEVEGRNERCYDFEADIVAKVREYESELGTRDSLGYLVETYKIPPRILIRPAGVKEKACSTPRDHWMPMHAHYLAAGLRFPIPELLVGLLLDYSVRLTQLAPNAMRKAKKANQNKYSLNSDEEEEVGKLVTEEGDSINIMYLTSSDVIEVAELYGPSSLSEGGWPFLRSQGRSQRLQRMAREGGAGKELVPSTSAGAQYVLPRPEFKRKGSEDIELLQRKKKVVEQEVKRDEVVEFVPRPPFIKLEPKVREAEVRAPGKGKELVPPFSFHSSLFDDKNTTAAKRFLNSTLPKVDRNQASKEVLTHVGATVVRHALEVCKVVW